MHDCLVRIEVVALVDHVVLQLVPQGRGAAHGFALLLSGLLVLCLLLEPCEASLDDILYVPSFFLPLKLSPLLFKYVSNL